MDHLISHLVREAILFDCCIFSGSSQNCLESERLMQSLNIQAAILSSPE